MEPFRRSRPHVLATAFLTLAAILAVPCPGQIPAIPGMSSMPQPDPVEAQKRVFAQLERCRSIAEEPSTTAQERAFCKFLDGLFDYSSGRRADGKATMLQAGDDLEAAGDDLGRILLLLQIADTIKIAGDRDTTISVLDSALDAIADLRRSDGPLSVETLRFFLRLNGASDEYVRQLDSIAATLGPMFLDQFELQGRLRLGEVLLGSIEYEAAEPHLIAARELSKQLFGVFDAFVFDLLGQLRERQGRPSEAVELYGEAAAASRARGDDAAARRLEERRRTLEMAGDSGSSSPSPPNDDVPAPAGDPVERRPDARGDHRVNELRNDLDNSGAHGDLRMSCADSDTPECRFARGLDAVEAGQIQEGLDEMRASLDAWSGGPDRLGSLLARWYLAHALAEAGEWQHASTVASTGLADVDTLRGSAEPLYPSRWLERLGGGSRLPDLGSPDEPMDWISRRVLLSMVEVYLRDVAANARLRANRLADAEAEIQQAVELSESFGGLVDGEIYRTAGKVAAAQGRLDDAVQHFSRAFDATRRFDEPSSSVDVLAAWADAEDRRGDRSAADRLYERAYELAANLDDPKKRSSSIASLAWASALGARDAEAIERWGKRVADLAETSGDPLIRFRDKMGRVLAAVMAGDHEEVTAAADGLSELAEEVARERPELGHLRASVAFVLGGVGMLRGRPERLAIQVEAARAAIGNDADELSEAWLAAGSELAKLLASGPHDVQGALGDLAMALRRSGSPDLARHAGTIEAMSSIIELDYESLAAIRQLEEAASTGDGVVDRWLTLPGAVLEGARGDPEAVTDLRSATEWFATTGFEDLEAVNRMALATLLMVKGRSKEAARESLAAIDAFDAVADGIATDEMLGSFVGRTEGFFGMAVWLVATEIGAEEALVAAEMVRARAFSSNLGRRAVDQRKIGDPELARQIASERQRVLELAEDPSSSGDDLDAALSDYREALTVAKLAGSSRPEPEETAVFDLDTLKQDVLPADTTLISFFDTPRSLLAWIIDRQGIEQVELPRPRRDELECFSALMRRDDRGAEPIEPGICGGANLEQLSERYHRRWIEPLESVARHDRWIVVPHDLLHYVPFAALRDAETGNRLIDRRTIAYAPSVSALRYLTGSAVNHGGRALVLGNPATSLPNLPGAEREALDVANLFGTTPKLGAEARESLLFDAEAIDVIHLAAHGVYRPRAPRFSYLALAEGDGFDGQLEIDEVAGGLDLDGVDLVTLSACQTALGEHQRGDEILSLPRAFLQAGAPAVVSTLWRVDDASTAFLMRSFYEHLRAGVPYGDALRRAQLETARQPRWSDPYFWAAFVLTGDPGVRWTVSES